MLITILRRHLPLKEIKFIKNVLKSHETNPSFSFDFGVSCLWFVFWRGVSESPVLLWFSAHSCVCLLHFLCPAQLPWLLPLRLLAPPPLPPGLLVWFLLFWGSSPGAFTLTRPFCSSAWPWVSAASDLWPFSVTHQSRLSTLKCDFLSLLLHCVLIGRGARQEVEEVTEEYLDGVCVSAWSRSSAHRLMPKMSSNYYFDTFIFFRASWLWL